ncbi:tripartite tricarboxylate transporter substrate binding protein [Phyllobacterium salinisoli]|uniref:Tripartite tricarboxylate transporter substrate binding protein n=1 Tax=Phyllobacterium salinisoli TaxID=1899321 RepID=A0A368K154_9HYPH|nr:tripartite tricarboxylate transporter substrate binding protein [Phyllobacterium salinisoli]RCS22904.1 tripartite tricarboxylate transporter substrate binding protein [Phyllobacterium salinisoli]
MICRRIVCSFAIGAVAAIFLPATAALADYPDRPITLIVPWGAGGGTDSTARIIGSLLQKELGQPVNVVNRTGGSGVVGHSAIAGADPDGYTLGIATVEIGMMHWQGLTELTYADYTPLTLMNEDPGAVQVAADAPWKDLPALIEDIKANPGKYKASGTGQGGIWHLAIVGLLSELGVDPSAVPWVPSNGAAQGLQDLVAGGVSIVPCSIPEARSLLSAGRVKSLAVMSEDRNSAFPDVPTTKEAMGVSWTLGAWRGIVAPKGLPEAESKTLITALKKVYDSEDYKSFMAKQGFGVRWASGEDFASFMKASNQKLGDVMKNVGMAK